MKTIQIARGNDFSLFVPLRDTRGEKIVANELQDIEVILRRTRYPNSYPANVSTEGEFIVIHPEELLPLGSYDVVVSATCGESAVNIPINNAFAICEWANNTNVSELSVANYITTPQVLVGNYSGGNYSGDGGGSVASAEIMPDFAIWQKGIARRGARVLWTSAERTFTIRRDDAAIEIGRLSEVESENDNPTFEGEVDFSMLKVREGAIFSIITNIKEGHLFIDGDEYELGQYINNRYKIYDLPINYLDGKVKITAEYTGDTQITPKDIVICVQLENYFDELPNKEGFYLLTTTDAYTYDWHFERIKQQEVRVKYHQLKVFYSAQQQISRDTWRTYITPEFRIPRPLTSIETNAKPLFVLRRAKDSINSKEYGRKNSKFFYRKRMRWCTDSLRGGYTGSFLQRFVDSKSRRIKWKIPNYIIFNGNRSSSYYIKYAYCVCKNSNRFIKSRMLIIRIYIKDNNIVRYAFEQVLPPFKICQ